MVSSRNGNSRIDVLRAKGTREEGRVFARKAYCLQIARLDEAQQPRDSLVHMLAPHATMTLTTRGFGTAGTANRSRSRFRPSQPSCRRCLYTRMDATSRPAHVARKTGRVTIASATRRSGRRRPRRPRDSLALFPSRYLLSRYFPSIDTRARAFLLSLSLSVSSLRTLRVSWNLTPYGLLFSHYGS